MSNKLASLLNIRPEEGRLALLVGMLFLCIQAGQGIGDNAASALFFLRFGVDFLPYMYLLLGATTFAITLGYSAGLGRFDQRRFFQSLILGLGVLLLVERAALELSIPILYPILWLTINCMGMILGTFTWNVAGGVSDARQAKRLFPLFTSAGILGSVIGNSATGTLAKFLGADNLLVVYALLLGLVFPLTRTISKDYFKPMKRSGQPPNFWNDLRSGFDFVRGSSLMKLIAFASILFSILFFAIAFPFSKVVSASFPNEAEVAGFLGLFSSVTTAVTFLVSLLLANRIYARLGIVNSILLMPLVYLFGFTVFAARYSLNGAVIARFSQLVVLSGVAGAAWNALFNVVPSQKRGQVLAFQNGVPSQVGVALSGFLLILGERALTSAQILSMGALFALLCGILVWRMRAAYGQALVDALRAGRLEVFSSEEPAFAGLQADAAALKVVLNALEDDKPATRRLAAEILGKMRNDSAIPPLSLRILDPEPAVRAAAIHSLGELRASSAGGLILERLDDPDANVRKQAVVALTALTGEPSPEMLARLAARLDDEAMEVRAQSAVALGKLGHSDRALPALMDWLRSEDEPARIGALEAVGQSAVYFTPAFESGLLSKALQDNSAAVRKSACLAFSDMSAPLAVKEVIARLFDEDQAVRRAAAEILRRHGDKTRRYVLDLFDQANPPVDAALDALAPGHAETLAPLRLYARKEIVQATACRAWHANLPSAGRAASLLRKSLMAKAVRSEERLVRILGLLGSPEIMELALKNLKDASPENRSSALEALETLGDKSLAQGIVAVLEGKPLPSTPEAAIHNLLDDPDEWTRALAARCAPELGFRQFIPKLYELSSSPRPLIQEAAREALIEFNEEPRMDTIQTISTLERVLILQEIPIFSCLSPEDLERIALIAREQWHPPGDAICHQGEEGDVMFVIISGQVQIVSETGGRAQVLAERGPGDFIGEMAIIDPAPRSAGMITKTETRVLAIDGTAFNSILRERPEVSLAVMQSIARRLREMMK
jgi:HEAT repeat protein